MARTGVLPAVLSVDPQAIALLWQSVGCCTWRVGGLHKDEVTIDQSIVVALLESHCPGLAGRPLAPAGGGTDNAMYRLGDDLLVRLPRTPDTARSRRSGPGCLGSPSTCRSPCPG